MHRDTAYYIILFHFNNSVADYNSSRMSDVPRQNFWSDFVTENGFCARNSRVDPYTLKINLNLFQKNAFYRAIIKNFTNAWDELCWDKKASGCCLRHDDGKNRTPKKSLLTGALIRRDCLSDALTTRCVHLSGKLTSTWHFFFLASFVSWNIVRKLL